MKRNLNTLCFVLVMLCIVALSSNNIDALQLCYDMGKGTAYTDATQKSFRIETIIRAVDMNIQLIAGILLIIVVSKINKGLVFVWQNITLFRWIGYLLGIHALVSSTANYVAKQASETFEGNPFDYQGEIAAIFVLMVAEIFAFGLRMKEEQDLTV